jgi:hypothetical protein
MLLATFRKGIEHQSLVVLRHFIQAPPCGTRGTEFTSSPKSRQTRLPTQAQRSHTIIANSPHLRPRSPATPAIIAAPASHRTA